MDELAPEVAGLERDYQIVTELRRSAHSVTYLGRHLGLNRDVTITIVRPDGTSRESLEEFASDARSLAAVRHSGIVPVIEARAVAGGAVAIVRARVRGTTLDQLIGSTGPMPAPRAATTLSQIRDTLTWARANAIVHRHVSPETVVFLQGGGRVLVELDPWPRDVDQLPAVCGDARTIGRLAYDMLTGQIGATASAAALLAARPELPAEVARETEALMRCDATTGRHDATPLLALLGDVAVGSPSPAAVPAVAGGDAVVVVTHRFGFGARVATAIVVIAVVAALAFAVSRQRASRKSLAGNATPGELGGEVGARPDTAAWVPSGGVAPVPFATAPPPVPVAPPNAQPPLTEPVPPPIITVPPPRHEPPVTSPLTLPAPATRGDTAARSTPRRDSAASSAATRGSMMPPPDEACISALAVDQQRCLATAVERADRELNDVYDRLIAALRAAAKAAPGDPDPPAVANLRADERAWLAEREDACRGVGDPPRYARARGQCFADQAAIRARELRGRLAAVPDAPEDTSLIRFSILRRLDSLRRVP